MTAGTLTAETLTKAYLDADRADQRRGPGPAGRALDQHRTRSRRRSALDRERATKRRRAARCTASRCCSTTSIDVDGPADHRRLDRAAGPHAGRRLDLHGL